MNPIYKVQFTVSAEKKFGLELKDASTGSVIKSLAPKFTNVQELEELLAKQAIAKFPHSNFDEIYSIIPAYKRV